MSHYISLVVGRSPDGRAGMVVYVGMGDDLKSFLAYTLESLTKRVGEPVMVYWAGDHDLYDMFGLAPEFPIPIDVDDMMTSAIEGMVVANRGPFEVELPAEPEKGVFFGFARKSELVPLQEVAIAAGSLAQVAEALSAEMPDIYELNGLSDASLADDGATFAGKPLALAAMFVMQSPPGQIHYGEVLEVEGDAEDDDEWGADG